MRLGPFQFHQAERVDGRGHQGLGGRVGVAPARGEQQPAVAHCPDVLERERAGGAGHKIPALRVGQHGGHPPALRRRRQQLRGEGAAVGVGAHPALYVQPHPVGVGVGDDAVVPVDDEGVPLTVDALIPALVGQGRLPALGLVAGDGALRDEGGGVGGGRPGRDQAHHPAGDALRIDGREGWSRC